MNILLFDDDQLVTSGIKMIIEMSTKDSSHPMTVCGISENGLQALELYERLQPDVVLMDIRMPEKNGIDAGRDILSAYPEAKIIYLTTFQEDEYIIEALRIGAKGYLLKTDFPSLIPAIEAVVQGQCVFGDQISAKIPKFIDPQIHNHSSLPDLSCTENAIVFHIAQGLNNKEIAEELHFSEGTIRNYLSSILDKLDLRDRTQLAIYYYKNKESEEN